MVNQQGKRALNIKVIKVREFTYPTYVGGIETCLHHLCPTLAELGVKITLITCAQKGLPKKEQRGNLEVRRIDFLNIISTLTARLKKHGTLYGIIARALFLLTLPTHLIKALKETDAHIIHAHTLCALSALPASIASKLTNKPLIITMHGTFLGHYNKAAKPPLSWIIPAAEKTYLRLKLYDKILVEDKYTYKKLRELGIPKEKLLILPYPGIPFETFQREQPTKQPSGEPIILHHGRLIHKRGIKYLIEAMPKVLKEFPEAKLIIAGDGPEKQRLKKLTEKLGLTKHVTFLGLVPHEQIPKLLKSSTLVVVPSLIEGHSASVIEAMAAEKPVIATRIGGVTEVIKDGETGILVDPENPNQIADAIITLLKNKELAKSVAKKAAESSKEYDVKKLAEKELNTYKDFIKKGEAKTKRAQIIKLLIILAATLSQTPYILPTLSSIPQRIIHIQDELLYSWVTLSACLLWLILKRSIIAKEITFHNRIIASPAHATLGLILCISSAATELTLKPQDFFIAVIPASVFISGAFAVLGSLTVPAISSAYIAGVALPILIGAYVNQPLSEFSASATTTTLRIIGIEASAQGAHITIPTINDWAINAYIDHVCAGSTSLSVFICLFTLITIDLNPKPRWKIPAFLAAGCLGTIAQATLRLIIMGIIGANYGLEAFLTAHKQLGYIIFPLYFILFTYIYIRSAREDRAQTPKHSLKKQHHKRGFDLEEGKKK